MSSPSSPRRLSGASGSVVGFLVLMEFSSGLLQGWFSPLLTAIGHRYDVSTAQLNWVSSVYLLVTVVCVPIVAKLGDRYGHKRMLTIAVATVAVGSIVVAAAPTFGVFLLGRAIQAPLAAFLPLEFAIVRARGGARTGKAIGLLVGALTIGGSLGLLIAGALGQFLSLTVVLAVPAVLLTICVPVVVLLVPETGVRVAGSIDWIGAALLGVGLLALLAGVGNGNTWGWGSVSTLGTLIASVVLLAAWVVVERRRTHPLVDLAMISKARITVPLTMAALFGAQLFGAQTPIALFAQSPRSAGVGLGLSPLGTGLLLVLTGVSMFVGATIADRVARRVGRPATLVAGGTAAAVAYTGLAALHSSAGAVGAWLLVAGIGNGLVVAVLPTVVVMRAPEDSVAIASALYNTSRTAAGAVAGAIFTLVMSAFVLSSESGNAAHAISSDKAYVVVWLICAVISATIALLSLAISTPRRPTSAIEAAEPVTAEPAIPTVSKELA